MSSAEDIADVLRQIRKLKAEHAELAESAEKLDIDSVKVQQFLRQVRAANGEADDILRNLREQSK